RRDAPALLHASRDPPMDGRGGAAHRARRARARLLANPGSRGETVRLGAVDPRALHGARHRDGAEMSVTLSGPSPSPTVPRVCAVVLNWNGRDDTIRCLESLRADPYDRLEVVVVDNGSSDGSPDAVARAFPEARWVRNAENLGIARGFNQG